MGILSVLGIGAFIGKCIKEACEPTLPSEYHGNWELEAEDANKVQMGEMSKSEFNRNISNGKYYAPIQSKDYLEPCVLKLYYEMQWKGQLNTDCCGSKYDFIRRMSKEEAREAYYDIKAKMMK